MNQRRLEVPRRPWPPSKGQQALNPQWDPVRDFGQQSETVRGLLGDRGDGTVGQLGDVQMVPKRAG